MKLSVVVCTRNEEERVRDCLETVFANTPDEVILVDGGSTDRTVAIAREFPGIRIIESGRSSLTADRQKGIDAARNAYVAMIDSDHRLRPDDLESLVSDMQELKLDIVQSRLISYKNHGFWDKAEDATWELTHNNPVGERKMIGTAPAIYDKRVFDLVRFDDHVTSSMDDTDFIYRLSKFPQVKIGVGATKIAQYHFSDFHTYVQKFQWYGKGDGQFCRKHPERTPSMIFHLLIRYPLIYSWRAARAGQFYAVPFFVLQGVLRFVGLMRYFLHAI